MNTRNWDLLLDAIANNRVVLVLGDDLFSIENGNGNLGKAIDYIKKQLGDRFPDPDPDRCQDVDFLTIEDGIKYYNYFHKGDGETTLYYAIYNLMKHQQIGCPECIKELVSQKLFPLIISTSFFNQIPQLMGIHEDRVSCYKKTSMNDIKPSELSADRPTLFYMFGQAGSASKSFMVTEDDYLEYLHLWRTSESRPQKLCDYMSDKYLLILGCKFPDWVFRFFWYSMKDITKEKESDDTEGIISMEGRKDSELRRFLRRIQVATCENVDEFVKELLKKLRDKRLKEKEQAEVKPSLILNVYPYTDDNIEFFISYASEDYETAKIVAETFYKHGAKVWFDKSHFDDNRKLRWGEDYTIRIKRAISKAKRFVPVISQNALSRKNDNSRFFRGEWTWALDEKDFRLLLDYIAPVRIDDYPDDADLLPEQFQKAHILDFRSDSFEKEIVKLIRDCRRGIQEC